MKEEDGGGSGETASLVAGNLRVIWDHPGSWGVGGGVYVRVSTCVSWGWGQTGTEKTSALDPKAGLEYIGM